MGETNSPSVAYVGYDISPLKRVEFKILTTSRQWPYKAGDLLTEVEFIWNILWQDKKKMTFKYMWLLNRSDLMGRLDCITYVPECLQIRSLTS